MPEENETEEEAAVIAAQDKCNQMIAEKKVEALQIVKGLKRIGGEEDYVFTIRHALKTFGGEVPLGFLTDVLPDQDLLTKARKKLIKAGIITEDKESTRTIVKLIKVAAPDAPQPAGGKIVDVVAEVVA